MFLRWVPGPSGRVVRQRQQVPFHVSQRGAVRRRGRGQGLGDNNRVVLYSGGTMWWATRIWWMLRAFGFDNAAVLNGGFQKWQREERPVSTEPPKYAPATFTPDPRPGLSVQKEAVLAALQDDDAVSSTR